MLQRRQLGSRSLTREHFHCFTPGVINEKGDLPADAIIPVIGHAERQDDGDRRIGGVASFTENLDPGGHGTAVPGGHRSDPTRSVPTPFQYPMVFPKNRRRPKLKRRPPSQSIPTSSGPPYEPGCAMSPQGP